MENGNTLERRRFWLPRVSVNTLKIAGAILMTLYFFGAAVIHNGILHVQRYTPEELSGLLAGDANAMLWAGIGSMAEIVGMIAISIFAYLTAKGAEHTSSMGQCH